MAGPDGLVRTFDRPVLARSLLGSANVLSRAGRGALRSLVSPGAKGVDQSMGQGVGWTPFGGGPGSTPSPHRVQELMNVYGGTDESVTWVFASIVYIASTIGASPWHVAAKTAAGGARGGERVVNPPDSLLELLTEPNQEMTYYDFGEAVQTDLELVGNSYWLKDNRNGLGQPATLERLQPDRVQIAADAFDRKIGYVYTLANGIRVPYARDQVIHYKMPNPRNRHYGMGTVEAIVRALDAELAETAHVTGFFTQGAHISGVLTVPETLGEDEFERIKRQYEAEFAASTNSFRVLIAEGATDFKQLSSGPQALGVVDLRRLSKDEILTGFGLPEFVLGGTGQGGVYKMEEAQNIAYRSIKPRAHRYHERTTIDLTSRWDGLLFRIHIEQIEPQSLKIERARNLLGAGASANEAREEAGLPRSSDPMANVPLVPNGLVPLGQVGQVVRPQGAPGAIDGTITDRPQLPQPGYGMGADGDGKAVTDPPALVAPDGFEALAPLELKRADPERAIALLAHRAEWLRTTVPRFDRSFGRFFVEQRNRVLGRLSDQRGASPRAKGQGAKGIDPDELWDAENEDERVMRTYVSLAVDLGPSAAGGVASALGRGWEFDRTDPDVRRLLEVLAEKVADVNDTTRAKVVAVVEEGARRGYPIARIANGYDREGYPGIVGVFDEAGEVRAETIARTESANLYNGLTLTGYEDLGIPDVEVMDGIGDAACRRANGSVWPLAKAQANLIAHPNCVRSFAPVEA